MVSRLALLGSENFGTFEEKMVTFLPCTQKSCHHQWVEVQKTL